MHTFGDKTLQGGCETKNFEEATKNHWKKQNPKFFPRRSNYEPKIGHNSVDIGKKDGGGDFTCIFFQKLSKFKMCAIIRLLLKISRKSVFDTHEAHPSEFSKTVFFHQYSSYSSFWGRNMVFENSLGCASWVSNTLFLEILSNNLMIAHILNFDNFWKNIHVKSPPHPSFLPISTLLWPILGS